MGDTNSDTMCYNVIQYRHYNPKVKHIGFVGYMGNTLYLRMVYNNRTNRDDKHHMIFYCVVLMSCFKPIGNNTIISIITL